MKTHFYNLRFQVDNKEWRARAKRDLVFQFWKKYQDINTNEKTIALDFGCGTGVLQEQLEKKFNIEAYGIDTSKEAIRYCRKRGLTRTKVFDGIKIPFKANTFDVITAIDVLEHIDNDLKALVEIRRVLRKNGLAIFLVPAHPKLWSTRDINLHHFRRYAIGELERKCRKAGFNLLESQNVDFAVYFLFTLVHLFSKREKGISQIKMDTASINKMLNEVMFIYEVLENKMQRFITFPIGLSIAVVVQKT